MTGKNKRRSPIVDVNPRPKPPREDCFSLSDVTSITSPVPAELAKLKVGTVLTVGLQTSPQIVNVKNGGALVGGLAPLHLVQLIECLKLGFQFSAKVLRVEGGFCEVHITCTGRP